MRIDLLAHEILVVHETTRLIKNKWTGHLRHPSRRCERFEDAGCTVCVVAKADLAARAKEVA